MMMGIVIGILAPAALALKTKIRRQSAKGTACMDVSRWILQYIIEILKNVFFTTATITYILRFDGVNFDALSSFPFFTKYIVIAVIYAWILPYVEEIISKYIGVSFEIEVEKDAKEKNL